MSKHVHKKNLMTTTALVLFLSLLPIHKTFSASFDGVLSDEMEKQRRQGTKHEVFQESVRTEYVPHNAANPSSPEKAAEDAAEVLRRQKAVEDELKRLQEEAEATKKSHRDEIEKLTAELREKEQRLVSAQRERELTEEALKEMRASQAKLKELYSELESKCRTLLTEKTIADSMLTAKDGLLSRKRAELKSLTDRLTQAGSEDANLRQNILKAEAEVARAQAAYATQKAAADKVASDLANAAAEREEARKKLAQLEKDRAAHEAALAELESALRGAKQESSGLKAKMKSLGETMGKSEQKILELQTRLAEGTDHLKRLTDYLQQMEGNYFQFDAGLEEALAAYRLDSLVNSMLNGLEARETMYLRQRNLLEAELTESRQLNAHLQTEKATSHEKIEKLEKIVRERTANLEKIERELAEKAKYNQALLAEKATLETQLSEAQSALVSEQRKHAETQAQLDKANKACARLAAEIKEHEMKTQVQADRYAALEKTLETLRASAQAEGASAAKAHAAALQDLQAQMAEEASAWHKEKEALAQKQEKLYADHQTKMQEWDAQRATLEENIKARSQRIAALETREDENFAKIKSLQAQVVNLDRQRQSLEEEYRKNRTAYDEKVKNCEQLEAQLLAQKSLLDQTAQKFSQAEQEKSTANAQLSRLQQQQIALKEQLADGQKSQESLNAEKERLATLLEDRERELENLRVQHKADSAESLSEAQNLQKNLSALRAEYVAATEAQDQQRQAIAGLREQLSAAEEQIVRLEGLRQEDGRTLQAEKKAAAELRAALEAARAQYSAMHGDAETQRGVLETARETLRADLESKTADLKAKELAFLALQAQYDQTLSEKDALAHQVHEIKEALAAQQAETRSMEAQAERANAGWAKEVTAHEQLQAAHAALESDRKRMDAELVELLRITDQQKKSIDDASEEAAELRSTVDSLRDEISQHQETISFLNSEATAYKEAQAQLEEKLRVAKRDYTDLEAKHNKALEQLDTLAITVQNVLPADLIESDPDLSNVLRRLSQYMDSLKDEVERHRVARGEAEVSLSETEDNLQALQQKLSAAQKQESTFEQRLREIQSVLAEKDREFFLLDAELKGKNERLRLAIEERDKLGLEVLELRGQAQALERKIEDLRQAKSGREARIAQLEAAQLTRDQELAEANRQLRRLTSVHDQSLETIKEFHAGEQENEAYLQEMTEELQLKEKRLHALDQSYQETRDRVEKLEETLKQAGIQGLKAVEERDQARQEKLNAQKDAEGLRQKLEQIQREKESVMASASDLQEQISLQKRRMQEQEHTIDHLRTDYQQTTDELQRVKKLATDLKIEKVRAERALETEKERHEHVRTQLGETERRLASVQNANASLQSRAHQAQLKLSSLEQQAAAYRNEAETLRKAFSSGAGGTTEYQSAFGADSRRISTASSINDSGLHTPTGSERNYGALTPGRSALQHKTGLTPAARAAMRHLKEAGAVTDKSGLAAVFAEMFANSGSTAEFLDIQAALAEGYRLHRKRQSGSRPLVEQNGRSPYRTASTGQKGVRVAPPPRLDLG